MAIKKIKLPDNSEVSVQDSRVPDVTSSDNGKYLGVSSGVWAALSKPSYTLDEVSDGSTRKLADYLQLAGGTMSNTNVVTNLNADLLDGLNEGQFFRKNLIDTSADCNTMEDNSFTILDQDADGLTCTNKPSEASIAGGYGVLTVKHARYRNQLFFSYTAFGDVFTRSSSYDGGVVWKDWQKFYHSGNANKSDVAWACSTLTTTKNGTALTLNTGVDGASAVDIKFNGTASNRGWFLRSNIGANNHAHDFDFVLLSDGTEYKRMTLSRDGNLSTAGTITPGSDSRIKDNKKDISKEDAFYIINNLKPKTWTWSEDFYDELGGKSAAGLVAQEVKEILPDAVTISENGDIKDFHSLNYNAIQGYEIAAIKGLIQEVKELREEIKRLKNG